MRFRLLIAVGIVAVFAIGAPDAGATSPEQIGCDPLDPAVCLQPFPNDYFTVPDATTDTGRRVNFDITAMPRNIAANPIRPDEWNRNDGFSPGQEIVTKVPGLDTQQALANTGAVPITDIARTYDTSAPVVVINADTQQRHLIWTEVDVNPTNPADANLIIRPAVNWEEGGHYIVALRRLKDSNGNTIPAQQPFRVYRDRRPSTDSAVEARRPHMEDILKTLRQSGIGTRDLYLAWDFTVASKRNLSERSSFAIRRSPRSVTPTSPTSRSRAQRRGTRSHRRPTTRPAAATAARAAKTTRSPARSTATSRSRAS